MDAICIWIPDDVHPTLPGDDLYVTPNLSSLHWKASNMRPSLPALISYVLGKTREVIIEGTFCYQRTADTRAYSLVIQISSHLISVITLTPASQLRRKRDQSIRVGRSTKFRSVSPAINRASCWYHVTSFSWEANARNRQRVQQKKHRTRGRKSPKCRELFSSVYLFSIHVFCHSAPVIPLFFNDLCRFLYDTRYICYPIIAN